MGKDRSSQSAAKRSAPNPPSAKKPPAKPASVEQAEVLDDVVVRGNDDLANNSQPAGQQTAQQDEEESLIVPSAADLAREASKSAIPARENENADTTKLTRDFISLSRAARNALIAISSKFKGLYAVKFTPNKIETEHNGQTFGFIANAAYSDFEALVNQEIGANVQAAIRAERVILLNRVGANPIVICESVRTNVIQRSGKGRFFAINVATAEIETMEGMTRSTLSQAGLFEHNADSLVRVAVIAGDAPTILQGHPYKVFGRRAVAFADIWAAEAQRMFRNNPGKVCTYPLLRITSSIAADRQATAKFAYGTTPGDIFKAGALLQQKIGEYAHVMSKGFALRITLKDKPLTAEIINEIASHNAHIIDIIPDRRSDSVKAVHRDATTKALENKMPAEHLVLKPIANVPLTAAIATACAKHLGAQLLKGDAGAAIMRLNGVCPMQLPANIGDLYVIATVAQWQQMRAEQTKQSDDDPAAAAPAQQGSELNETDPIPAPAAAAAQEGPELSDVSIPGLPTDKMPDTDNPPSTDGDAAVPPVPPIAGNV